jgi:hypothetical protein
MTINLEKNELDAFYLKKHNILDESINEINKVLDQDFKDYVKSIDIGAEKEK